MDGGTKIADGVALERAAQWVRDEVDRLRRQRGLPGLSEPWNKPPCPHCEGTGYIPIGTDIDGYHWVRRCSWCNPDPPQGKPGTAALDTYRNNYGDFPPRPRYSEGKPGGNHTDR